MDVGAYGGYDASLLEAAARKSRHPSLLTSALKPRSSIRRKHTPTTTAAAWISCAARVLREVCCEEQHARRRFVEHPRQGIGVSCASELPKRHFDRISLRTAFRLGRLRRGSGQRFTFSQELSERTSIFRSLPTNARPAETPLPSPASCATTAVIRHSVPQASLQRFVSRTHRRVEHRSPRPACTRTRKRLPFRRG